MLEKQPSPEKINLILSVLAELEEKKKVDASHYIRYNNKHYKLLDDQGMVTCYHKGTSIMLVKSFDESLFARVDEKIYALEEILNHKEISRYFSTDKEY